MAQNLLRLRQTLSSSTTPVATLHRALSATSALSSVPRSSPSPPSAAVVPPSSTLGHFQFQSRSFRSSSVYFARPNSSYGGSNQDDEIGPDTILFEGCDYNHWLIVMDFPRDNKPPPEEMIRTYEETAAKGLNISVEEAKKKIYACSTTTYTGFQVLTTEEESEKFNGVPGVIFVLPDSYIDPQNKEYGGDKYENGVITPRPPPFQYERQGSRYRDRNRYDRQGPMPNQQGNSSYGQQGSLPQGGGNYRTPQNLPQQTYGPPGHGESRGHTPVNSPAGRDAYVLGRDPTPTYQGNYNQRVQRNAPQGDQSTYAPPSQGEYRGNNRAYDYAQGPSTGTPGGLQGPGTAGSYGQGPSASSYGQGPIAGSYGQGPSAGSYGQGPSASSYGQGPIAGSYGQGPSAGSYGQGPSAGSYGQGPSAGSYGQGPTAGSYRQGPTAGSYGQGPGADSYGQGPSAGSYGQGPSAGSYGQGPSAGSYGQGPSAGSHGQGQTAGSYGQGPSAASYGQGPSAGNYGQGPRAGACVQGPNSGYHAHGDQSFTQGDQRSTQGGEQTNCAPTGQTGTDRGRY